MPLNVFWLRRPEKIGLPAAMSLNVMFAEVTRFVAVSISTVPVSDPAELFTLMRLKVMEEA